MNHSIIRRNIVCYWRLPKIPTKGERQGDRRMEKITSREAWIFEVLFFFLWHCCPTRATASSFLRFLHHPPWRITVGSWTSDQLVAHTYTWHKTTSMSPVGFEPTISACTRPQTYSDRAAIGTSKWSLRVVKLTFWHRSFTFNSNKSPIWCNNFQFIIVTFVYSSTCFGRFPAHHQELNDCSGSLWFYLRIGRPAGPTTNMARLSPRYEGKTRGCHCSHWAPDNGRKNTRNMLSCKQTSE